MAPAVVLDLVARLGDALYDACSVSGSASDHEERGPHRVLCKQVEDARRPSRVRAVVERQVDALRISRRAQERRYP
jgi:hypothetical protein